MGTVREPKKVNSIEKKHRIIEAGLKVFSEKGFYNTNTAEIAKIAGVSTGIVYSYFKDKKDIFLHSINLYFEKILSPIESFLNKTDKILNNKNFVQSFIDIAIKSHENNYTAHEEIIALSHLDQDVHNLFMDFELKVTRIVTDFLLSKKINPKNINERVHLAYNVVENLCHEYVYHKHKNINYTEMIQLTTQTVLYIFN